MKPTKSFIAPRVESRCVALEAGVSVKDVADAARDAALGFAWGADRGWGRRELARWLVGPYARAVAVSQSARSGVRRAITERPLAEDTVKHLLRRSHAYLLDGLRSAATWRRDASFAREMIDEGFVVGVVDESSAIGYAPLDAFDMRLVDRVRSLFVADFLTRAADYDHFGVCETCGAATFDGTTSHAGYCGGKGGPSLRRRAIRTHQPRTFEPGIELVHLAIDVDFDEPVRGTLIGIGA
jgi:hypothetical protein